MVKARISKASAPRAIGVGDNSNAMGAAYTPALAIAIAQGLNGVMAEAAELRKAFDAARGRQLPFMLTALAGVAPITSVDWEREYAAGLKAWAIAQGCTFGEDGKPMKDGKVSAYAATSYSVVKVATIAITNGIAPLADESLQGYVKRVRAILASRGLIDARAPTAKDDAPKVASAEKAQASAARVVAKGDSALADCLAFVAMPEHAAAFKGWVARYRAALI